MKQRLTEHFIGIVFVSIIMIGAFLFFEGRMSLGEKQREAKVAAFSTLPVTKINDPFEKALLADCMDLYYPGQHDSNEVILGEWYRIREQALNNSFKSSSSTQKISVASMLNLCGMYVKFLIIYLIVMLLTYYGVQTLGTLRFVLRQQSLQRGAALSSDKHRRMPLATLLFTFVKFLAYFILFSPAYVIAYSIRTEFNTDSSFFMIILGVISNGLLITYTNKFYTFLVAENRKGYVENALVKNLRSDYSLSSEGITWHSLLSISKKFKGHVFDHIFKNARYQYLSTIKEQASFLITGLIIIEMALNIHGHLTYELLRQLLYKNYLFVIIIMLFIFYTVKLTEIVADVIIHRESQRYENR
jgi:hypothetical protein